MAGKRSGPPLNSVPTVRLNNGTLFKKRGEGQSYATDVTAKKRGEGQSYATDVTAKKRGEGQSYAKA